MKRASKYVVQRKVMAGDIEDLATISHVWVDVADGKSAEAAMEKVTEAGQTYRAARVHLLNGREEVTPTQGRLNWGPVREVKERKPRVKKATAGEGGNNEAG